MDPLRPFSDLIRALWKSNARRVDRPGGVSASQAMQAEQPAEKTAAGETGLVALKSEVRARLGPVGLSDKRRAREVFVEAVMARELGLGSGHDQEFSNVARRVAARIGSHPRLSERLHVILTALMEGRPVD
jgi:hypothetical protein